jgi:branched-chain amino acid transport system substrate-binding protein
MKNIRAIKVGIFYFGMCVLAILLANPAISIARETIRIGVVCGLSGAQGPIYTDPYINGVKLAVEEVNKTGGILGKQVELVIRDDELKVDIGVREIRYLILRADVDFIIGGHGSNVALGQSEIAKANKVPYMVCLANSLHITESKGHRYVFQLPPSTRSEANAVGVYLSKQRFKKLWTIGPDYDFGRTVIGTGLEKLRSLRPDIELLGQSWPKMGEKEMSPYISQILSANPEMIFNAQWGADMVSFIKQAKPYGMFQKFGFIGMFDQALLSAMGDEMVEGVIGYSRGDFFAVKTPEMNAYVQKYRDKYKGEFPQAYATFGYEAIYSIKHAMEKAQTTDKEKVVDALKGLQFTSPRGSLYFRDYQNIASGKVYVGKTFKDPKYPFYVYKDIMEIPAEETWISLDEIRKLRGE